MHLIRTYQSLAVIYNSTRNYVNIATTKECILFYRYKYQLYYNTLLKNYSIANALRPTKPKSKKNTLQYFVDLKQIKVKGGNGGNGAISFLQLWVNDRAGPDGGDGGHGGHVILQVTDNVKDLSSVTNMVEANNGEKGASKNCNGKNANHTVIKVPVGTIVRDTNGIILADLDEVGMMYIAALGGAGGRGNTFFKSDIRQIPKIAEYGAEGEIKQYILEVKSMAHIGLIGLPNAGKSTLLRAITRARPKVANYPFTTLKPHIGMIQYDDYEQIAVADLPGLIQDSHQNQGLGIAFLKHVERCKVLMYIIDISQENPWTHLQILNNEISQFNDELHNRPKIIIANKIDVAGAIENYKLFKEHTNFTIFPISAKMGTNLSMLLREVRILYDKCLKEDEKNKECEDYV